MPAPISCINAMRQLWDFLDGELSRELDAVMRHHLATCTGCSEHVEFCRSMAASIRGVAIDPREVDVVRGRVSVMLRQS